MTASLTLSFLPKQQFVLTTKRKSFCQCDEKGSKSCWVVGNTIFSLIQSVFKGPFQNTCIHGEVFFNPLLNNKILEMTKLKAFADDKLNVADTKISLYERAENTVGKGENAGYQHFSPFPTVFSKAFF